MSSTRCYLDYNATTPLLSSVKAAMIEALDLFGNPSSVHHEGRMAKAAREEARRHVAALFNADPEHVIFTSGASEAAHFALTPQYQMGRSPLNLSHLYFGATEHPAISNGGQFHDSQRSIIPVDHQGLIKLDILQAKLNAHDNNKGLALVAIQAANHETGVIQPMAEIARLTRDAGGLLLVDLVQYATKDLFDINTNIGDFFIVSAHKIGGPKGIGALITRGNMLMPKPLIRAGGQEKGHRGGTEALPLIVGFGAAAKAHDDILCDKTILKSLQEQLEEGITKLVPDAIIYGKDVPRLANTTFFTIPGMKAETMQIAFDLAGFSVSAGSACSSGKVGQSAVLKAMGVASDDGAIRVSTSVNVDRHDIDGFLAALEKIVSRRKK